MSEESKMEGEAPEPMPLPEGGDPDTENGTAPNVGDGASTEMDPAVIDGAEPIEAAPMPVVSGPLTAERLLDRSLGVAVLTGEAIDRAAQRFVERTREIQEQAPAFWALAEERGRPIRENLFGTWSETPSAPAPGPTGSVAAPVDLYAETENDLVSKGGDSGAPVGEATASEDNAPVGPSIGGGIANSLRSLGSSLGFLSGGGRQSAEDEIRTLESRVRELEQVVASGATGSEAASEPVNVEATAETPADGATYVPGAHTHEEALADSPYAISETAEEQQAEATGTAEESPAAPPAPRGRKKQRETDPGAGDQDASSDTGSNESGS